MWLYGWILLNVSQRSAKCDSHRHCGSGDVNIPVNTVIFPWLYTPAYFRHYYFLYSTGHVMCHARLEYKLKEQFFKQTFFSVSKSILVILANN